jgi:1,3-beta-glucan synthase
MFFVYVVIIAAPLIIDGQGLLGDSLPTIPMQLMQPTGWNNNDTHSTSPTGFTKTHKAGGPTGKGGGNNNRFAAF